MNAKVYWINEPNKAKIPLTEKKSNPNPTHWISSPYQNKYPTTSPMFSYQMQPKTKSQQNYYYHTKKKSIKNNEFHNNQNKNPNWEWIDMPLASKPYPSHCTGSVHVRPFRIAIKQGQSDSYDVVFSRQKTLLELTGKSESYNYPWRPPIKCEFKVKKICKFKLQRIWDNPFAFMNNSISTS